MLWLVGVVADFVDNFNTGIMVRSGTEGRKGSWECCRLMRTVGCVWCRVHSSSYWIPTSKDLFVPSIALGFVHCSYSRANCVRKVNRRHETCRTAWLFRQRIESVPLEIIVDSSWSEAGIPMQNTLLTAKHAHTHTCSEQSLRILMWNASYVQKHSNYTWQEWVDERTRERFKKLPSPWAIATTRCKELEADRSLSTKPNRSHLDRLRKPCDTRKLKTSCLETSWWFLG